MSDDSGAAALPTLRLKRNEDRRLQAGHVWVFSNEIDTAQTPLSRFKAGDLVRVLAHNDRALGLAYVNPNSLICARLLSSWQLPDREWFAARLRRALALRERFYAAPFYRWVYGESDFLPGLVIDRFDAAVVVQINTAGMERLKDVVVAAIEEVLRSKDAALAEGAKRRGAAIAEGARSGGAVLAEGAKFGGAAVEGLRAPVSILIKNDSGARDLEQLPKYSQWVGEPVDAAEVVEAGCRFGISLAEGQKTGWFYDQAANRDLLARFVARGAGAGDGAQRDAGVRDGSARLTRVLDVFSYVGAWGTRAAKACERAAGASAGAIAVEVTCVDASASALEAAVRNGERNGVRITARKGDAFDVLEALAAEGARFDVVIVDPPAFAKRKKDIPQALAAYKRINQLAMRLVSEGGILVACSCSYHISAEDLRTAIGKAGRGAERSVQIFAEGTQAPDHPVLPAIEETRYLKAFYCRIGDALK